MDLGAVERLLSGRSHRAIEQANGGRAAVAAVLRQGPTGVEVLLIRRAEDRQDPWSGHMALPGGRRDPEDADLLATAIRETREEVGLPLHPELLLGRLDDVAAVARGRATGMVISPHVFRLAGTQPLTLNDEVAEALWAPLAPMLQGDVDTERPYTHEGETYRLPAFDVDGHVVWGLTYQILRLLLEAVAPR